MDVVASDPYIDSDEMAEYGVKKQPFDEVIENTDTISAHAPLTEETAQIFDADVFSRMKPDAYFINVARGGLVDEDALKRALEQDDIQGAAIDVFYEEPADEYRGCVPNFENDLRELDNVIFTPRVVWYSVEASNEKRRKASKDIRRVLEGEEPKYPVNEPCT